MLNEGGFSSDAGSLTTLKLMFVNKIRLIRMHPKRWHRFLLLQHLLIRQK